MSQEQPRLETADHRAMARSIHQKGEEYQEMMMAAAQTQGKQSERAPVSERENFLTR